MQLWGWGNGATFTQTSKESLCQLAPVLGYLSSEINSHDNNEMVRDHLFFIMGIPEAVRWIRNAPGFPQLQIQIQILYF